jgi:cobalamin biosynthesis Mg chelatase CobN
VDNNNGGQNSGGNTGSGDSGNNSSTDQSGSNSDSNGQETQEEKEKLIAKVTETKIITEEAPAMTDTVKYLIVFLAVLSVALVFIIGYIAMRMCTRKMKPNPKNF